MIVDDLLDEINDLKMAEEIASLMGCTDWQFWEGTEKRSLSRVGEFIEGAIYKFRAKLQKVNDEWTDELKELREKAGIGKPEPSRTSSDHPEGRLFNQMTSAFFANDETWKKIKAVLQEEEGAEDRRFPADVEEELAEALRKAEATEKEPSNA